MNNRKNILLILTDQHRYDIVGANGSPVCRSPHIDSIAASGVNFQQAYSICPLCTPARASIYTGMTPHKHGVTRNTEAHTPNGASIGGDIPTLAERLTPAGYDSFFFGKWHAGARGPHDCGFQGMDVPGYGNTLNNPYYLQYLEKRGYDKPQVEPVGVGYPHHLLLAGRMSGSVGASVPYFLAEQAIEQIKQQADSDRPAFIALNFWGPHAPYLPCEPYASMYDPADIPPWPNFEDDYEGKPPIYSRHHKSFVGEGRPRRSWEECAQWAALYFGFATQIDDQIGRVLAALEEFGLTDSTTVIFSSDHGDLCGSHGGMHDKNAFLCQELMHVPLMMSCPDAPQPGRVSDLPVSSLDIPATIMDLAGVDVPECFDGRSLAPIVQGKPTDDWPDYVAAECQGVHFAYETRMIVHAGFKYVFHPGAFDELYNLETDLHEMSNLIDDPAQAKILRECRRRMLQWMRRTNDPMDRGYYLFEKHTPWSKADVADYGPHSARALLDNEPVLFDE